jgi:hypothetical protein
MIIRKETEKIEHPPFPGSNAVDNKKNTKNWANPSQKASRHLNNVITVVDPASRRMSSKD